MSRPSLRPREFCVLLPCAACGRQGPSDPDHAPTVGAGGDDRGLWPLCHEHHVERHQIGFDSFCRKHRLDGKAYAARVAEHYVRVFGAIEVFSDDWPRGKRRLQEVRKDRINAYLPGAIE